MQIPRGPEELNCPFWQKPMSECCHTCPMWKQLRGVDKQTGKDLFDEWNCTLAHMPALLIENSYQMRHAAASADKVADTVDESNNRVAKEIALLHESVKQGNILNSTILLSENGRGLLITADKDA